MTAIGLFHQYLQAAILEGTADETDLTAVLRVLIDLNPFQVTGNGELGFSWIADILNSGYEEDARCRMAREVVRALGKHVFPDFSAPSTTVRSTWISPLLGFLSLCEKLGHTRLSLDPAFAALHILSISPMSPDFATEILLILRSTLLPTHPLRSRSLALEIFTKFISGWFSPQIESIPSEALDNLLQAVGDPFKFPDPPLQDGKPVAPSRYRPMMAVVVLIEFASSPLWRNHLRHSNFASCEEAVSTREGKRTIFRDVLEAERSILPKFLHTAAKVDMAIRCLEELRCLNTTEVVIMWAWAIGAVHPVGRDDWRLIGRETLRFYQTHGMKRLAALRQHIIEAAEGPGLPNRLYRQQSRPSPEQAPGNNQRLTPRPRRQLRSLHWCKKYICLAQTCQVHRLYHLFGYDPATWKEAVAVGVGGETGLLPGCSVAPASFMDWACDYPQS